MERVAGCDLGKAAARFVVLRRLDDGSTEVESSSVVEHRGRALDAFLAWYAEQDIAHCRALGATGLQAADLAAPVRRYPIDACQEAAIEARSDLPVELNLVSLGARGYSVLARQADPTGDPQPVYRYFENEKCSSGTGENILKIAARFGLELSEADARAERAASAIPITARCSVFAKSEMTHFANQGRSTDELFRGYFESVARNAAALVARNRSAGPVFLIGGCTRIRSFVRAFERALEGDVRVLDDPLVFEARGAALLALRDAPPSPLPTDATSLLAPHAPRFAALEPSRNHQGRVTRLAPPPADEDGHARPCILGLDIGSTGAKALLTAIDTGTPLFDVYDRTRGNPVDAARRLLEAVLAAGPWSVRAVGFTGSGREAARTLFHAVSADPGRLVVLNEIVAHAMAARSADPERGADLSVIEIGGQDAKYIRLRDGKIVESDLNKACSAGTGSFLEEQAAVYGVASIEELSTLAASADRPPDLGQMCTVYVADAASQALRDGFSMADVFAGFQYSVIHNYLNRVMGQRPLARRIFFQGKPATSPSLAWTLASVTGREITVPPNPGAMGAWGIGLCVLDQVGPKALAAAADLDLTAVLGAEVVRRTEFRCQAKGCGTLCPIERVEIRTDGKTLVAMSGGACPLYEEAVGDAQKLPRDAPDAFADRRAALRRYIPICAEALVAVPMLGPVTEHLPWLATFLQGIGVPIRLIEPRASALAEGELLCNSFDSCGPTKIAHALCDVDAPWLFFPKILDSVDAFESGGEACVTQQSMPELVEQGLLARGRKTVVLRPVISFSPGGGREGEDRAASIIETLRRTAPTMGLSADPDSVGRAIHEADLAQGKFCERRARAGEAAIAYGRKNRIPIVLVCGSMHVIHDPAIHATIPDLVRRAGALAVPVDCFPVPSSTPRQQRLYWADWNRSVRAAIAAREAGDVYPLLLSSFQCGPASFAEHIFEEVLAGYPHTILESDGHGGAAGFVTRIQAFLHSARRHGRLGEDAGKAGAVALSHAEHMPHRGRFLDRNARYVFLSGPDYLGPLFAAVYRAHGYQAEAAPPLSEEGLRLGRHDCSGKECLSYQMMWGAFRQHLERNPPEGDVRLMQIGGRMCRSGAFSIKDRMNLDRMGLGGRVTVQLLKIAGGALMSLRSWAGSSALDLVRQMYLYHLVCDSGAAKELYARHSEAIVALAGERMPGGWKGLATARRHWKELRSLLARAAAEFQAISGRGPREVRTVFLSGDLLTKANDFANGGLPDALARHGVRCIGEPMTDFMEYLAIDHEDQFFGRKAGAFTKWSYRRSMPAIRRSLHGAVAGRHPWLPRPDVRASLELAGPIIDRRTNGAAVLGVGTVLHAWNTLPVDGVVVTACWGCDNTLIDESLLRRQRQIPLLCRYDDATPLDERQIESFAWRLMRRDPHRASPIVWRDVSAERCYAAKNSENATHRL